MEKTKVKKKLGAIILECLIFLWGAYYNIGILLVLVVYCSDKFVFLGVVFSDTIQDSD